MAQTSNFLGYSSVAMEKASFSIIPAPTESGATYCKGQSAAPQAILEASAYLEDYDEETALTVIKEGVHCIAPGAAPKADKLGEWVMTNFQAAFDAATVPAILGGDGTATLWGIQAMFPKCDEMSILHLDAHADMDDGEDGENHHTIMRRVLEMGKSKIHICQVGIRSLSRSAFDRIVDDNLPVNCFFMSDLNKTADEIWQEDVIEELRSPVYLAIDLTVFDPSVVPAVGNPQPGGLGWWQVLRLLRKVASRRRIAAFDITELCPREGDIASDFTAAKLLYKVMNYIKAGGKMLEKPSAAASV